MNSVNLVGRLGGMPELKHTTSGVSVTTFSLAVPRSYVRAGEERETDWFEVVAWNGTAEFVCRNCTKGQQIAVTGALQVRRYTDKDGRDRKTVEVVSNNITLTGDRRQEAGAALSDGTADTEVDIDDSDLPF